VSQADIGVWGLGVMGRALARNIANHGFTVAAATRTTSVTEKYAQTDARGCDIIPAYSVEEFINLLAKPRRIILMVKAGDATDATIERLVPHLDKDDILIDGGNAFYRDTIRRHKDLTERGLRFIGTGISGGEEGALNGPSIMPGGSRDAYDALEPVFTKIAAQADGSSCCTYIGHDGAGHFVKMVHNGIEYGDMQLICEAYYLMKHALQMEAEQMQQVFAEWNRGELNSYLIEITADILSKTDPETQQPLVEMILDTAQQKGTGAWTSQTGLELGVPIPTIAEAVFARCISAQKQERLVASGRIAGQTTSFTGDAAGFIAAIRDSLYASKICAYAQGFALMTAAAHQYGWDLQLGDIAMIWRGGCIIRAKFLQRIKDAYERDPALPNLLLDPYFRDQVQAAQPNWRKVVAASAQLGLPTPAFSSALNYFDSYRAAQLSANLIQAQRDYFGAHTYERTDRDGTFHTDWPAL